MKRYHLYLISTLIFLVSCAEEGPFKMGKLECEVEVSAITPTTVNIKSSYPQTNDNILEMDDYYYTGAYLSETPLQNNMQNSIPTFISPKYNGSDKTNGIFFFSNLKPNTKYYVITGPCIGLNHNQDAYSERVYYYTGVSFTTAQEGDYSGLGEATCEIIEENCLYTRVKVKLPNYLKYKSNPVLEASINQDMTDSKLATIYNDYYYYDKNEAEFIFTGLDSHKYFLRLKGYFQLNNQEIKEELIINFKNTLDISQIEKPELSSAIYFAGADFSIFDLTLPENSDLTWNHIYNATWKYIGASETKNCDLQWKDNTGVYVVINDEIKNGAEIIVNLKANVRYNGGSYCEYDFDKIIRFDNKITKIQPPVCETILARSDYSVVKVDYPSYMSYDNIEYYISEGLNNESFNKVTNYFGKNVMLVETPPNVSSDRYIKVKGSFKFPGLNDYIDGTLNTDGSIKKPETNEQLLTVSTQMKDDILKITITCPSGFSFSSYEWAQLKCSRLSENVSDIFITGNNQGSSSQEIVFNIYNVQYDQLRPGEKYELSLSQFTLIYDQAYYWENDVFNTNDVYNIEWTYLP